ncbi:universal stress protein [uncultured Kordia sp.]|uniref:universal stress protein n=1 Tax=uncultured Kordia sp. TaxID=507699 RepID=UPI0026116C70|nr:universal stress protein [uncultured Kordia sp.]
MTKILLPTDFSENAWSAIVYALQLYVNETCTFYLLNATKLTASRVSNFSNKLLTTMRDNAKKDLLDLKTKLEGETKNSNHEFEVVLNIGELSDAVETAIDKYKIDLVIMGTKGATGAKEIFFGSNTTKIIKKIKSCPLLMIPDAYSFTTPKQIAFPTDFNRNCDAKELHYLKRLADLYGSKIRVVHINENEKLTETQQNNYNTLQQYLTDYECSFHWIPDYTSKAEGITNFIDELEIDILAMIYYSHSFIERITREPVIKKIGFQPTIPFLVIPE